MAKRKDFIDLSAQEYADFMRQTAYGTPTYVFPGPDGIYEVAGGIPDVYYLNDGDAARYCYLRPAYAAGPYSVADCWIVDIDGNINPGTNASPVPFCREAIGRRVTTVRGES